MSLKDLFHLNGGINESDSPAKKRHLRITNIIALTVIANTTLFILYFYHIGEQFLLTKCLWFNFFYTLSYLFIRLGFPTFGRHFLLLSGNVIIFYAACMIPNANIEMFFFSLIISPFFFFSWEERKNYYLCIISIILFLVGEYTHWRIIEPYPVQYDVRYIRLLCIAAPLHQIISGFYYFINQSVKYETENAANLVKLGIEHQKQIQVQKMSSLGEMAGGIAHEINNPLTVITGKTYKLKKELKETNPSALDGLEKIDSMVQRISKIIGSLRNFARNSENDPPVMTDVRSLLESTLDLCRERFSNSGILINYDIQDECQILCRPSEISQVLLNLLNNAFDAVIDQKKPTVLIQIKQTDQHVEINVIDNGSGVDPKIADKIMQPFYSTKEIGKGTGLGLSISKGIIESHHGTLNLVPTDNLTIFRILLPKA